ncbi:MAG: hypothetical protein ACOYOU_17460, partial [Kiritimatiellia bacterium]
TWSDPPASILPETCANDPVNGIDPTGLAVGHHLIPQSLWDQYSDEVKKIWDSIEARIETPGAVSADVKV